jgi:hypothetical protein
VDKKGTIFNMADIAPENPGNFVAGTAIRQRSSDEKDGEGDNDK